MSRNHLVWPGSPHPLGAAWDGSGTNFALFSAHAERVDVCLFDNDGRREIERVTLPEYTNEVWHGYLPDVRVGQLYGFRVYGPYAPERGHRFNHHKLLLDPYAKALTGVPQWDDALFGYTVGHPDEDLSFDDRDSAPFMPKCQVIDPAFTWGLDQAPARPWHETLIYEMHVRGFTMAHPDVPQPLRGTFGGLSVQSVIAYLQDLNITAMELLPVHAFVHDRQLVDRGLRNYWGYNSVGFLAPHPEYLSNGRIDEFKTFVQLAHLAGIEVILDVVYNHTAEGNHLGPTLSFRGIDNRSYYYLQEGARRYYNDFTGTGNSLELRHPRVLQLVMDSLRYWVEEMRVDGFRFDLATTLARVDGVFDEHASFLDAVAQDPSLSGVKLIAEPWDIGDGGYQLGRFPPGWLEWNDRFRDSARRFWRGEGGRQAELASRLAGSSDLYNQRGRRPWASVNFVTAHDGFTLADLVSYDRKHNEENQEDNQDGSDENFSWNGGVEGPTDDPEINELRRRQKRNLLATLLLSQGLPMMLAGDEFGHSQNGNNNVYCQDNERSWLDWNGIDEEDQRLADFTRALIKLRRDHIVFHRHRFFHGREVPGTDVKDIVWLRPDGEEMRTKDWEAEEGRTLAALIRGEAGMYHVNARGEQELDHSFFLMMNADDQTVRFVLPGASDLADPVTVVDTFRDDHPDSGEQPVTTDHYDVPGYTLVLLRYPWATA